MTWVKTQGVFTNKPWHKSWLVSKSRSESRCRSARWWLAPRLSSEYHSRTDICFTNTRNYCHRNKIYVLTSLLKQIYLQSAECARIYCTVNTEHGVSFLVSPSRIHVQAHPWTVMWRLWVRDDVTIVAIWVKERHTDKATTWYETYVMTYVATQSSLDDFPLWIRLDLDPDRVSSETRSGSKPSLESSLKSRLLVNMAPAACGVVTIIATLRWASCGPGTGPGPQDAQRRVAIIVTTWGVAGPNRVGQSREIYSNSVPLSPPHWPYPKRIRPPSWPRVAVASSIQNTKLFTWRTWPGAGAVPKCDWAARSQCGFKQRRADHTKYI